MDGEKYVKLFALTRMASTWCFSSMRSFSSSARGVFSVTVLLIELIFGTAPPLVCGKANYKYLELILTAVDASIKTSYDKAHYVL